MGRGSLRARGYTGKCGKAQGSPGQGYRYCAHSPRVGDQRAMVLSAKSLLVIHD